MASNPQDLSRLAVAVTGAARGIGRETVRALVAGGARVVIGDLDGDAAAAAARETGAVAGVALDVRDPASFAAFLDAAETALDGLDVLVNNAGVMPVGPLLEETAERAALTFDVNVHGVLHGIKLAAPRLAARGGGRIVNVASYAGVLPVPGQVTYAGSKAAVLAITEGARWELEPQGVHFTAVVPSFTATDLIAGTGTVKSAEPITPQEVAEAVVAAIAAGTEVVYVPGRTRHIGNAIGLLPRGARQAIHHRLGTDTAFMRIDHERRRAYDDGLPAS